MSTVFSNKSIWANQPADFPFDPTTFFEAFKWFYLAMGGFAIIGIAVNLVGGYLLQQKRNRSACIFLSAFNCLFLPLGTILGVVTIINLQKEAYMNLFGERIENSHKENKINQ